MVLVSNDQRAFAAGGAHLAPDLVHDLRERGHAGRVALYLELSDFTAHIPKARELVAEWTQILTHNPKFTEALTAYLLELAHSDATTVIGSGNLGRQGHVRNPRFTSFENPRDVRFAEVWVSSDGSAILDVSVTLDYTQEFEIAHPSGEPEPIRARVEATGTLELSFEVIQRDRNDPTGFAGHMTRWRDVSRTDLLHGG